MAHVRKIGFQRSIKQFDGARGYYWIEAWIPFDPTHPSLKAVDAHGEVLLADDVRTLAHAFMTESGVVDVMHDGKRRHKTRIVESFINGPEIASPHFEPGAWVVVVDATQDPAVRDRINDGTFKSVSFEALVNVEALTVDAAKLEIN